MLNTWWENLQAIGLWTLKWPYLRLFWTYIWNIQWRCSLYVCILCGLLLCDSSHMCKKCWLCFWTPLYSCWWFGMSMDCELSWLPKVFFPLVNLTTWGICLLLSDKHYHWCVVSLAKAHPSPSKVSEQLEKKNCFVH